MKDRIDSQIYYPMLISSDGTVGKMSPEENTAIWKTYFALTQLKQDMLTDEQIPKKIIDLQDRFKLQDKSIAWISLFIRKIFFGELSLAECEAKIGSMLLTTNGGDPNQAKAIVDFVRQEILTIKPKAVEVGEKEEKKAMSATVNMPLLQAVTKYEKLGQQIITNERIKLKSQPDLVRPSLVNWIKYYRDELGIGFHDSVQRGNFLFRSENCKKLSSEERERINLILKSVEENYPLPINTEKFEVVFPEFASPSRERSGVVGNSDPFQTAPKVAPQRVFQSPSQNKAFFVAPQTRKQSEGEEEPNVSFSLNHVFPAEKEGIQENETKNPSLPKAQHPFNLDR